MRRRGLWVFLASTLLAAALCQDAEAYQIKRIIRGSTDLGAGANEITSVDLTTPTDYLGGTLLDTSKTLVFYTVRAASSEPTRTHILAYLDDEQTVTFARFTAQAAQVEFTIVEFVSGVNVFSGITVFGDCTTSACRTKNITLPQSVDVTKSIALVNWKSYSDTTASTEDELHAFTIMFTAGNKVQIKREDSGTQEFGDVYYQVIEFDEDVDVQSGTYQTTNAGTSYATSSTYYTTGTVTVTNGLKAITGSGTTWTTAMDGQMFRVGGSGPLYKFFRTGNTTGNIEPAYEGTGGSGLSYEIGEFFAVNENKSIMFLSTRGGTGIAGVDDYLNTDGELTDTDTLTFYRGAGGGTNDFAAGAWFVLTFLDEGYTQRGRVSIDPDLSVASDQTIAETEIKRNLAVYSRSMNNGATTSQTHWDDLLYTMVQTSGTNLRFVRNVSGNPTYVSWFTAEFPPMKVLTPDGGETIKVGDAYDIDWEYSDESQGDATCTIQVYLNSAWRDITTATCPSSGNSGTYEWTVPPAVSSQNVIGTTAKIRVFNSSITFGTPDRNFDDSNANFEIKGKINLTAPVTSQNWVVDNTETISWSNNGNFNGLGTAGEGSIYYSVDGNDGPWILAKKTDASDADNIALGADAGSGGTNNFSWKIPDEVSPGNNVFIKIEKNDDPATYTISPTAISIKRALTLTSPGMSAGESYTAQTPWNISWTYKGQNNWGTVKLQYSTDAAHNNWTDIVTGLSVGSAGSGSYGTETALNIVSSTNASPINVEVTGHGYSTGDTVQISGHTVNTAANGDWTITVVDANHFTLDGTTGNGVGGATGTVARTHLIPVAAVGSTVKVRVTSESDPTISSTSNNDFTVTAKITLDTPSASGIVVRVDGSYDITWSITGGGITTVKLEYSTAGPTGPWTTITSSTSASGSPYPWTVPNAIGTGRYVKISDTVVSSISDVSNNGFEIKGQITNLVPNGGEVYDYASTTPITWNAHGSIGTVAIKLYDDDIIHSTVATGVSGAAESYDWDLSVLPVPVGTKYKIRVEQESDPTGTFAYSDAIFRVKGVYTITAPTGGAVWYVSDTDKTITWTKNPATLGNTKIEYTPDNGTNWYTITASTAGTSYPWNPVTGTGLPDSGVLIRVSLASDPTVSTTMGTAFKVRGKLTLIAPSASGLTWEVGTQQSITWDSEPLNQGLVELRYSKDGGPFTLIDNTTNSSAETFTWTVPDAISTNVLVRVSSLNTENESAVTDDSDNALKIRGRFVLNSPNGSETWRVGETRDIIWRTYGTVNAVKLFYSPSSGSGGSWNLIASAVTNLCDFDGSTDCVFDWGTVGGVADSIVTTNQVRVEDNSDSTAGDNSNADFTILGNVTLDNVSNPTTEILRVGGSKLLQFTKYGTMNNPTANFKLLYAIDGSSFTDPDNVIATTTGSSFNWTNIPDAARSDTAKIKVQWEGSPSGVYQISPVVKIKPSINVTTDSGTYNIFDTLPVTFSHTGRLTDTFEIYYSDDNGATYPAGHLIHTASNAVSPYTYDWSVPSVAGIVGNDLKFKVVLVGDATDVMDESLNGLTILGFLGVTTPTTGTVWTAADTNRSIVWTSEGISTVRIDYSLDGGVDNYPYAITGSATGTSFLWNPVPAAAVGDQVKIRVKSLETGDPTEAFTPNFTIKPQLIITAPNGPGTLSVGDPLTVSWTSSGAGNIKIEYSTNADQPTPTWTTLPGYSSVDSTLGSISTTVPDAISDNVKFRLSNINANPNLQVESINSNLLSIKGKLTLQSLTGAGLSYTLGDSPNVSWSRSGTIGAVKVEYYNGSGWSTITSTAPTDGPFALLLDSPNTTVATDLAKVRISAANGSSNTVESANAFMVKAYISVTNPAGNEAWVVDSSQNITWGFKGSNIANVKIEYSKDSGANYNDTIIASTPNDGTHPWTIPDDIRAVKDMKVRVSTLPGADPWAVAVASNGLFQIVGELAMKVPNDATPIQWRVGTSNDVEWTNVHGSVANVKLEYSTNAGTGWSTLISTTPSGSPGDHTYTWNIPNNFTIVKDNFRIRVSDAANNSVTDASTAASSILANFTFVHPLSGEVWVAENTHTIEWTTPVAGVPATVKVEYNVGSGWVTIPESDGTPNDGIVTNSGSVNWTLPVNRTTAAQIRLSDPADSVSAVTSANFKIRGDFTVTAPNSGAESWEIATYHDITWTKKGNVSAVKLEWSNSGSGGPWTALVDGDSADTQNIDVSGAGPYTFNWKIPDISGITTTQARIRVVDVSDSTVYDYSDNNFTVKGRVELTTPNGGETLGVGNTYGVTGNAYGVGITSVRLYYSTNGGATWDYGLNEVVGGQVVSVTGGAFSQNWSVPDRLGSNLKVRVEDSTNSLVNDDSNAAFSIKGTVSITSPTNLSVWAAGSQQNIVWDRNGTVGNVDLFYNVNDGPWQTIATSVPSPTPTGNTYAWTLPTTGIVSTNVKVKIDGANLLNPTITSAFTVKGAISLTYPDATGISLTLGDPLTVTWSQTGSIGNVKVEYYDGSTWTELTTTAPENGPYQFTLNTPITTIATAGAKIRVSQANDATVTDTSANDFMVKPFLQVTSPAGDEAWVVGSSHDITWNKIGSNVANVKIEYSKDSGANYNDVIVASTTNDGSYSWTIPDDIRPTKDMKVRISTLPTSDLYAVTAVSGGLFQIVGALEMVTPDDTTPVAWRVGTSGNEIKWNATGSITNVKIEYSSNSGGAWATLVASTPSGAGANKTYSWNIPNNQTIAKDTYRFRVLDAANTNVLDASNAASSILANFTFVHPVSGEVWVAESAHDIEWTTPVAGTPTNVKLEYDLGGGYQTIVASTANSGIYNWTLPAGLSTAARVRISDPADAVSAVVSDPFKIRGNLTLTSPTGGESWTYNTNHDITWTKLGNITAVKLEYTTNGTDYTLIATAINPTTGTPYNWTIPDVMSQTVQVKVTDTSDSTVFSQSAVFTIQGTLTLTAPNGAEEWVVGTVQNITWNKTGSIANVKLEYSTNGGGTYPNTIIASTSASAAYPWTIPDAIGTQLRVRVTDAANAAVLDTSNANFIVKGALTLTAPNGGEILSVGSSTNITWTRAGSIANVKLEYSTNGGTDYPNLITAVTDASAGTYAWTVPDALGTQLKVRVTDASDSTVLDVSNGNFTIRGALSLTAPNGSEVWRVGQSQDIVWQRFGSIANVKLEYSTNGGSSYPNTIIASTGAAAGTYTWTIPDAITIQARVRVTDVADSSVFDDSDANFAIKGIITVTAPNGGESWGVSTIQNVTWTKTGSIANVKIEYSTDGGSTFPVEIVASTDASTGTYAWTIPDDLTIQGRVKVTNVSDSTVFDASNANFKIVGALFLTAPDSGEGWAINSAQNITWTRTGSIANVKIELSTNGGSTFPVQVVASTPAGGLSYNWTIPDLPTTTAKIRISDANDATVNDVSAVNFRIQGTFDVTSPNLGTEIWDVGSSHDITWDKVGSVANVRLEYSTDGGANYGNLITASTGNTGTYSWTVPDAISSAVRVHVSDVNDYTAFDVSDANFKIRGVLVLTSPNGGEDWDVASVHPVTWTRTGSIANVKLEYSTDGGSNYPNLIVASVAAADLTYDWTLPDALSTQLRVKITDTSDPNVTDVSNANFTIKGALVLTAPNGGEQWIVTTGQNITWTRFGSIANVKLDYSVDGGTSYPNAIIASTDASLLSYTWTIPDTISTTVRVRVMDTTNSQVLDVSNANFAIRGSFTIIAPNGGETWVVGESRNITWSRQGSIPNAKLEYSTNGGSTYPNVIVGATDAATGSYAWTVPDAIDTDIRVKISDVGNAAVFDESNADFIIKGSLTLTAPNGTETWIVGASENITWNRSGTIATVLLEYSTNGGSTYPNVIIASTSGLTGTYAWTVADAISAQVRVRVSDTADPTVIDASDANFTIKGSITVTAPNGTEAWVVNSTPNITWTKTGTISTVKIEYSINGGSTYPNTITASTGAAAGTYAWTVPDDIQSAVRVKVTNNADTSVFDASDTNFKIVGSFTLTAPNGTEEWKVGQNNNVTWTKVGSIVNAKLEYSINGGSTYPNTIIASTPAGALSYTWNVPDSLTTQARVRISDAADATVLDTSDANFEIQASFTITAPDGGEVWVVGSSQDITWDKVGSATNVKLEYSVNGGSTYPNLITASTGNSGTFSWTVPDSISSTVKVRVADVTNDAAFDVSNANFKIRGSLTVTAPNGSESWNVNTSQNITWTRVGSIANVKLEYSTDQGTSYPNLINGSVDASLGTYAWTIPDAITANGRVKVTDASDSTVSDESNNNFRIRGTFTLVQPNGTEVLDVASVYQIQWTKVGSIADAKLEYSIDGGGTYPNVIVGSIDPAALLFDWTVPDSISTLVRVRIVDNNDAAVLDASNANLKIRGVLTLTAPNGSEVWDVASARNITWTKQGSIANARLEYSTNGGSTYPNLIINSVGAGLLTYSWTVPDSISSQVRVKITNLADATVTDESDANFKIVGVLTILSPNGSEVWPVGSSQAVTWSRVGSIANAKLEYSSDGGVNYDTVIAASTPAANLSYGWTVPDVISSTVRVKISDVLDATVADTSDANFKIRGDFVLTSPNGNEAWVIGSSHPINWTRFGSIANAKLEYSTNGGVAFPNTIIASVPAANETYNWTIPDNASTQVRVRVSQVGDSTVYDDSDGNFTIRAGFTVTSPVGGEAWAVGSSHDLTWVTGGTIPNVKLEYSTNAGNSYTTIIGSTPNNQTYAWVVPDAITIQGRIKVSDINDPLATDASPANFKIHGTFTLAAPNGAEQWLVGSSQNITWTKTGSIANAKLEYSTDGGSNYPNLIIGSTSAAALSYSWTIPDAIGPSLKVRITDAADAAVFDVSDNVFRIKAAFTITSPNGSEDWVVASIQNVTWGTLGTVANIKLEYATDGGTAYSTIVASTGNAGTYAWTVPDAITTQARVRVSDVNDSSANDASDGNFKIRGSLTITAPNGAEKWNVGTNRLITWDRTGSIPNVKLEYSSNNGTVYTPIIASTTNTGSYSWTIPDAITTQALVRITDLGDNTVTDVSNATFKIMGNFTVTSPNGGEVWSVTSSQNITWTSSGTMNFTKIEYSTDGGSTFPNLIVGSTTNNGLYGWSVPDAISGQVRVRVSDPNDSDAYDDSNANFRVRMTFTLTAPNGGQKWSVASSRSITWNNVGTIPNVKLQFSRDGFLGDIVTITNSTPSVGSYSWTIPDAISNTVRVRVSDPNDIGAFDDSNADFKIMGGFTLTAPNGGEKWDVGSTQTIAWTPTGTVPDAKLEYSTDGGASYPNVIAATPNTGTYDWLIPDTITAALKVRVSDLNDTADAFDVSDANAKIRAKFTLTAPNGGQIWTVGDSENIAWTTVGTVANVKLDYSTDSGSTFPGVIAASTPNTSPYAWTIPDAISTNVRVRVMSATDVDAFDASDANLKIRGKFNMTAPNGGEQWRIAQANNITWTTTGTIPNVMLMYSTNGGSTFPNVIAASVANANSYSWTIPDTPTASARVRIEDVNDATVFDESSANFSIQGFFTLTAPNGGEAWFVTSSQNITWTWGGTIPNVKLSYSTNGGSTYPNVIAASTANGVGSAGSHSYPWTVPDNISPTVRVKIEDPGDASVFDESDAVFKIIGRFTMSAPNGGERWVTNEVRNITWTTDGTIPNVKIEYSYDDFATPVAIAASTANAGTYAWTIPDPGIANVPDAAKVRVTDVNDTTVYDDSNADFNIDYYYITWEIRDLVTNASLSQLSVTEVKASDPQFIQWSEAGISTNPPRVQPTPYGTWVATWSKSGFGDGVQVVVADQDQSILLFMETSTVHIWLADSRVTYDPTNDVLDVVAWLSRDGSITTGGISSNYKIYDGSTLLYTLTDNVIDAAGFFNYQVPAPTGLVAGKVYTAICEVAVGSGGVFKTPTSFEITTPKKLQDVKDKVDATLDKPLSEVNTELQTTLNAQTAQLQSTLDTQTTTINTKLDAQTQIIQDTLNDFEQTIQSSITALESAADLSLESAQTLEETALKFSWKAVVAPNPALSGDQILLQAQGPAGLHPFLSVYNNKNRQVIANGLMNEDLSRPGNYSFKFAASAGDFEAGEAYTYIVTEDITGGLVAGSGFVEAISLTSVAGLASAAPAAEKAAKEAVEAIRELESTMAKGGDIRSALKSLQKSVAEMPAEIAKASGGDTKQIRSTVNDIAEKIQQLAGNEGLDLSTLIGTAIDESATVQDIASRSNRIQQGLELLGAVVQRRLGGADEPIVATFLEPGA